jgi:beta-galactosidase
MRTLVCFTLFALATAPAAVVRPFDADWQFLKADAPGAEQPGFDDHSWRKLSLPHDWAIEGPFDPKAPTGQGGAFLPSGIGWYRKSFSLPQSDSTRDVFVDFDGVMANSDVWINGFHLGKRPYGYISFRYDLTGHMNFGAKPNVVAVRVDDSQQPASRWYPGAGINRHVRLVVADPVHVAHWSTFVTTPKVSGTSATVHVQGDIENRSNAAREIAIQIAVLDPKGATAQTASLKAQSVEPGKPLHFEQDLEVRNPALWDLDTPVLYRARVRLLNAGKTADEEAVPFGIREYRFDADTGFWLNGRNFKIKGVCLHYDAGGLGTAVPLAAWERRFRALKEMGVNAIRTAHGPPAPEFLDLADRMGFLVMDEMFDAWTVGKNPYDYHIYFREWSQIDTHDNVMRDRNHPSVILYSAGNEIHDTPNGTLAKEILGSLVQAFHNQDPTRPVTQALFRPNASHDYDNGLADMLDVVGQNYREPEILAAHAAKPTRKIIGTENQMGRNVWLALRDNPAYSGQFLWVGMDYLGEAGAWPVTTTSSGLLDRTGAIKPIGYERESWWSDKPMVRIFRRVAPNRGQVTDPGYEGNPNSRAPVYTLFADWNPASTRAHEEGAHEENLEVYSNCADVELFLNGKSLGSKALPKDASSRNWRVAWEPGSVKAVCKAEGVTDELKTAGKPAKIVLSADKTKLSTDWNDLSYITARVTDEAGVTVPDAGQEITFEVSGHGSIAAVDNADYLSHESFQASSRKAFQGSCIAVVRSNARSSAKGGITVRASSPGLLGSGLSLTVD